MISVPVDPGYAYDLLSILDVKDEKVRTQASADACGALYHDLARQVGTELHFAVTRSPEFASLKRVNLLLFELIDRLKAPDRPPDVCYDRDVDQLNYQRYLGKRALQQRFFPDTPQTEVKLGYPAATSTPLTP